MRRALLAGGLVVALVVGTVWAAYTADVSGDGSKAILVAIEAIFGVEDAAHTSGDNGVPILAVRNDTLAELAGTDGDYAPLQVDADGALYVAGAVTTSGTVTEASASAIAADLNELTAAPVAKNWVMGGAVVAAGPAPAPLAASETFARKVIMTAVKAAGTANTSVVYIGDANLVDTTAACIQLAPGDSFTLEGSPGTKFDLNLLKIDGATAADGVRYIYQPI